MKKNNQLRKKDKEFGTSLGSLLSKTLSQNEGRGERKPGEPYFVAREDVDNSLVTHRRAARERCLSGNERTLKRSVSWAVMMHAFMPTTQEAEAGESL